MNKNTFHRHPHDADIQPDAPMLYIPDVALHPFLHLPEFLRLSAESRHLRPTCDARLHKMTHHIFANFALVHFRMVQHVRSRPHYTHITHQHVPELRQLIYVVFSYPVTKGELSWIVLRSLQCIRLFINVHRAELIVHKILSIHTRSFLSKE